MCVATEMQGHEINSYEVSFLHVSVKTMKFFFFLLSPLLCRWKYGEDGQILQRKGKAVLEFVAVKSHNISEWTIPGVQYKKC